MVKPSKSWFDYNTCKMAEPYRCTLALLSLAFLSRSFEISISKSCDFFISCNFDLCFFSFFRIFSLKFIYFLSFSTYRSSCYSDSDFLISGSSAFSSFYYLDIAKPFYRAFISNYLVFELFYGVFGVCSPYDFLNLRDDFLLTGS